MANNFSWGIQFDDKGFKEQIKQDTEALKELDKSAEKAGNGIDKSQHKFINAKKEFNNLRKELLSLTIQYQNLSKEDQKSDFGRNLKTKIDELTKKAGSLKDTMGDLDEKLKNVASDTQFADGLNMMAGTIGNVSSAIVALTGDSDNMKKVLMDIAKIQATVKAIESLTNAFQKQNRVLLSNPYTLVAAGIAALVVAIGNYKSKTDDATSSTKELNKSFKDLVDTLNKDLGLEFGEGLTGETLDRYVIASSKAKTAHEKWLQSLDREYRIQQYIKDGRGGAVQELEKQKQETAKYRQEWQDASKALNEFKKTSDEVTKTVTKNSSVISSGLTAPKYFKTPEFKEAAQLEGQLIGLDIQVPNLEIIPNEVKDKYLRAMRLLGEEGQKAFWDAVEKGDSYEVAFKKVTGQFEDTTKKLSNVATAANSVSAAFNTMGSAMQAPVFNVLGTIAQSIANIALAYSDAFVKDQGAKTNIFAFIASVAAGVASMLSTISAVKSAATFSDGGIFNGKTSVGDYNIARVNDGEMILNNRQQGHLFRLLDSEIGRTSNSGLNGTVEFKIKAQELVGVVSNHNKKMGKIR